ncbi:MAG: hypothetical protein ABI591_02390, partial [Kofleriaceae bacterium]
DASLRRPWPIDPYSSASMFDGWKQLDGRCGGRRIVTPSGYDGPMVWWPKTWLLSEGWRKRGLISMYFVPGGDE